MDAKIVLLDIETAPNLGYTWGKYEQNVIRFERPWFILAFSYKVLGEKETYSFCLPDFPLYNKTKMNDLALVKKLWEVLDEADIVVAHNGDSFDLKKSNARFAAHHLPPPSLYKSVDTLKIAKKHFKFESNSLSDLGEVLGVGKKSPSGGFDTWLKCMSGDPKAWALMRTYNARDVELLEQVYLKLRAWSSTHPNVAAFSEKSGPSCPTCGGGRIQRRGLTTLRTRAYQRLNCQSCGRWFAGEIVKNEKEGA